MCQNLNFLKIYNSFATSFFRNFLKFYLKFFTIIKFDNKIKINKRDTNDHPPLPEPGPPQRTP